MKKIVVINILLLSVLFFAACAPTWVHTPAAPDYYAPAEPIPVTVGINIEEAPFGAQWWGHKKIRQDYGPEIVEQLKKMRVFNKIIYPYVQVDTNDKIIYLSVKGKWSRDNKGRAFATFLIGTPNYDDFEGAHEIRAVLRAANDEIADYTVSVNTKGQYSGTDGDMIAKELNDLQIKKIAIELANRFNADRALIMERIGRVKEPPVRQETVTQPKDETQKADAEKLDKLRESGIISEDEYKRAKEKIAPPQADAADTNKKLQELDVLRKDGVLSEKDYNRAKKRLTELQKLEELRQNGTLTEDEYKKAKARLSEK